MPKWEQLKGGMCVHWGTSSRVIEEEGEDVVCVCVCVAGWGCGCNEVPQRDGTSL